MWIETLKGFLEQPVDGSSLALFRGLFGILLCGSMIHKRKYWISYYTYFDFYLKFPLFRWVKAPGLWGMRLVVYTMIAALACFALGLFYQYSIFVAFALYTYIFLLDKSLYNNHFYLIVLFLFLFNFVDAAHVFALDSFIYKEDNLSHQVPYWNILIFQLQLLVVYTYGGVNKLTYDWLMRGQPMTLLFRCFLPKTKWDWKFHRYCFNESIGEKASQLLGKKYSGLLFSWVGMLFDLFIVWLMLLPSTLPYALPLFIAFHLFNLWFFTIGVFPYLNFCAIVLFLSPEFSRRAIQALQEGV